MSRGGRLEIDAIEGVQEIRPKAHRHLLIRPEFEELAQREIVDLHAGTFHISRARESKSPLWSRGEGGRVDPTVRPGTRQHRRPADIVRHARAAEQRRAAGYGVVEAGLHVVPINKLFGKRYSVYWQVS
jgi:hypothetical protein